MRKRFMPAVLLLVMIVAFAAVMAGCSSGPDYKIDVTKELYFQKEKASPFEIKVTENGKAVTGLSVSVELSMSNMDHGTVKAKFAEGKGGTYSADVKVPMNGKYEAVFNFEKGGKKTEKVISIEVAKPEGVAKVNGKWITNEDVTFYKLINRLQLEINREAAKKNYSGAQLDEELAYLDSQEKLAEDKNQLLTQIIRLRSMAMLAEEKGHKAEAAEVDAAVEKARGQYAQFPSAQALIKQYGEEKFWTVEKQQYKLIVLAQMVQKDLVDQAKKENPKAGDQEVYYQAQKKYEDLLVSQINSLKVEIL
ncbi:FixH family protein [Neobacillus citreus]|uniref:FixH family protein n=1 Tax=Neobacillus citreus TaxID=2833578 RepID=A0A942TAU6_9BACI|nr:FixH family protein [Neobacillus citreus]MCH6268775.1 FixH family protein [Neobacillus citreus]